MTNHIDKLKNKLLSVTKIEPTYEIEQTYSDPIYQFDLSSEISSSDIVKYVYDFKKTYPISRKSTIVAWHSDYDAHEKTTDFNPLIELIQIKVNLIEDNIPGISNKLLDSWVAIYNKSEYTKMHNHAYARWAVVYYAKAEENCAPIVFKDLEIIPKTNMLLVFPGRMQHMVRASTSDVDRIVFAANFDLLNNRNQ